MTKVYFQATESFEIFKTALNGSNGYVQSVIIFRYKPGPYAPCVGLVWLILYFGLDGAMQFS